MYDLDVDDLSTFDLALNLEAISIDTVCAIITEVVAEPAYQRTDETVAALKARESECSAQLQDALSRRD